MSRQQYLAWQFYLHNKNNIEGYLAGTASRNGSTAKTSTSAGGFSSREIRRAAARAKRKANTGAGHG